MMKASKKNMPKRVLAVRQSKKSKTQTVQTSRWILGCMPVWKQDWAGSKTVKFKRQTSSNGGQAGETPNPTTDCTESEPDLPAQITRMGNRGIREISGRRTGERPGKRRFFIRELSQIGANFCGISFDTASLSGAPQIV